MNYAFVLVALFGVSAYAETIDKVARPIVLIDPSISSQNARLIAEQLVREDLIVAAVLPEVAPTGEEYVNDLRGLYRDMQFARLSEQLSARTKRLIDGQLPSAARVRALAELQLWAGAVAWVSRDAARAHDAFVLAKALSPGLRPEKIFPPEVQHAFSQAKAAPSRSVTTRLAPAGARLWVDGKLVTSALSLSPGIHYVVLERADRVPKAALHRITGSAGLVAINLDEMAARGVAIARVSSVMAQGLLSAEELRAVAQASATTMWWLTSSDEGLLSTPYRGDSAGIQATPARGHDPASLIAALCRLEDQCLSRRMPTLAVAPSVPITPPRPLWRKGWFWGAIGGGAAVVIGVGLGVGLGVTSARDYVVHVR